MTASRVNFVRDENGWVSPWSIFLVMTFLIMGGLAVDYANGIQTRAKLQAASDSAALAASMELPNTTNAAKEGVAIAERHFGPAEGNPIETGDFIFGNWDADKGLLVVGGTPVNAVQVDANRTNARSNGMTTYLLQLIGRNTLDVVSKSIAVMEPGGFASNCVNGGFFTNSQITSGSNNDYYKGFCLYGRNGVKIGSDNTFEDSNRIIMEKKSSFQKSGNNTIPKGVVIEKTYTLSLLDMVNPVISSMKKAATRYDYMPKFIHSHQTINGDWTPKKAKDIVPGTLYRVKGKADLKEIKDLNGIAIVADKEIEMGGNNGRIYDVVFATPDKININSDTIFEHPSACGTGVYSIYFFSGSNIEFGSNTTLTGVQMAAKDMIKIGSNTTGFKDVYGEAQNNIEYQSNESFTGCGIPLTSEIGSGPSKEDTSTTSGLAVHALVR